MNILKRLENACRHSYCTDYECTSSFNCNCNIDLNEICRCSTIDSVNIYNVDISSICKKVLKSIKNTIQSYCIERLLFRSDLVNPSNWQMNIVGGYYGEETDGADCDINVVKEIKHKISKLMSFKSSKKMIEYILVEEYGHVLPRLKNKKWTSKKVKYSDIIIPNQNKYHYTKLDRNTLGRYNKEWLSLKVPRFLCVESFGPTKLKLLIDGYHRYEACNKKRNVEIILGI